MAIEVDIGTLLFRDVLKMTQYPGSPFSGNIINDIVLYFFIPTVFIIFFIYLLLGRIVAGVQWLRMLMGLAIFLFMIVNGWFAIFAMLAGPYFIFLIVVLGGIYFIPSHFRITGGEGGGRGGGRPAGLLGNTMIGERREMDRELREARTDYEKATKQLEASRSAGMPQEAQFWAMRVDESRKRIRELEEHLKLVH